jgi:ribosome-binding protein aMBF1 (putative translation factor)
MTGKSTMSDKFTRVSREITARPKEEYDEIRRQAKVDFPPLEPPRGPSEKGRIALAIRDARNAQGLTFEQLAQRSGLADADTVRDIEYGADAKVSDVAAIGRALGLRLELVADVS